MKKLLLIALLIVGCEEVLETLNPDVTSPTVVITFPSSEVPLTAPTTVKAQVSDNGDIITSSGAISYVKFLIDGAEVLTDTIPPYEYEWDVCVQATGTHTITVIAEDMSSNIGLSEVLSFTINASYDCALVCGGNKLLDNCEVCDADTTNDCVMDCADVWGGDAVADECGTCDNDATNDGTTDNCGVCDTDSINNCIPDLEGTWIGNETNSNNVWTCIITGNEMDFSSENEWYKGTFSINTQIDPKQLDYLLTDCFINEGIGLTVLAIYKIENNSMTFAGNEPGSTSRPDSFVGGRIMVLEKQ